MSDTAYSVGVYKNILLYNILKGYQRRVTALSTCPGREPVLAREGEVAVEIGECMDGNASANVGEPSFLCAEHGFTYSVK